MSVAAPLRIGVVGVGRIGALHAETLSELDGVSLILADANPVRAAELAGAVGATAAASPERLFEDGIDAVVIATTRPGHVPLLRLAVAARVPAFCEKPVALELAALTEISQEVRRRPRDDRGRQAEPGEACRDIAGKTADEARVRADVAQWGPKLVWVEVDSHSPEDGDVDHAGDLRTASARLSSDVPEARAASIVGIAVALSS
jgi:hypothetical protein